MAFAKHCKTPRNRTMLFVALHEVIMPHLYDGQTCFTRTISTHRCPQPTVADAFPSNVFPLAILLYFWGSGSALHIGEVISRHTATSIGPRHDSTAIPLLEQFKIPFVKFISQTSKLEACPHSVIYTLFGPGISIPQTIPMKSASPPAKPFTSR